MVARDPHRFVNELDKAAVERLVARLESRAKDKVFTRLFDKYADRINPGPSGRVLEVGCGTGAATRALAHRGVFSGKAVGVDQSVHFIQAARQFALDEGIARKVDFHVGDAVDQHAQTCTHQGVVVGQQDSNRRHRVSSWVSHGHCNSIVLP